MHNVTTYIAQGLVQVNFFTTLVIFITKRLGCLGHLHGFMDYDKLDSLMAYSLII
jgi:hypothetical protein